MLLVLDTLDTHTACQSVVPSVYWQTPAYMIEPEVNANKPAAATKPLVYVVDDEPMLLELATVILERTCKGHALQLTAAKISAIHESTLCDQLKL